MLLLLLVDQFVSGLHCKPIILQIISPLDGSLSCPICKKQFRTRGGLKHHLQSHDGKFPYHCSICQRGFISATSRDGHMSKHSGIKPFSCSFCVMRYTFKKDLKHHLFRVHGIAL